MPLRTCLPRNVTSSGVCPALSNAAVAQQPAAAPGEGWGAHQRGVAVSGLCCSHSSAVCTESPFLEALSVRAGGGGSVTAGTVMSVVPGGERSDRTLVRG